VKRTLEDLEQFHAQIVDNRRTFLADDVARVEARISRREAAIEALSSERAGLLEILRTHGALDEHNLLQGRVTGIDESLRQVKSRLTSLRKFEQGSADLKIRAQDLEQRARRDYSARVGARERAIRLFNASSEALYNAPGKLIVDVSDTGFRFNVEIERSKAQGIESMKAFCFDLMLAQLWAERAIRPGFLLHDTPVFDPVDTRQRAHAIELAANTAEASGFQYICAFNSDQVPYDEFSEGFDFDARVRLRLADRTPAGGLFGVRF